MSTTFSKSLSEYLKNVVVAPPYYDMRGTLQNMVVYPILPLQLSADPPAMITLSEALDKGLRLTDTGVVSRVQVDNPLPTSILAGESEILIGATQLRSVQFSCLLAPQRKAALPVNCVEEGRATKYQAEFDRTDACPWPLRSYKMEQLARFGEPPQYWVWDRIKKYLSDTKTSSDTHDIHSVLDQNSNQLQTLRTAFPLQPGQVGTISTVGQSLFIELFGEPELLEDRYDNVLRSAMAQALAQPSADVVPPERIHLFLNRIIEACQKTKVLDNRSLKEGGRALAFNTLGISGQALVAKERLVHLVAHQQCIGHSRSLADLRPSLEAIKNDWEEQRPAYMDKLAGDYAHRRRRYNAFKSKLQPSTHSEDREKLAHFLPTTDTESAPQPQPLNPGLHQFFLRLFNRH